MMFRRGVWPTPVAVDTDATNATEATDDRKRAAFARSSSPIRALGADWQIGAKLGAPEQLWRLAPPPPGWAGLSDLT